MKSKFLDKQEFYINKLWFQHRGYTHRGSGVLSWDSEKGFHLIAKILDGIRPEKVETRSIEIVKPIRMMFEISSLWGRTYAMTPKLNLSDSDLYFGNTITINFRQIVYFQNIHNEKITVQKNWHGSALYETKTKLLFPDPIHSESKIGEIPLARSFSRTGFDYHGENQEHITGELIDSKYLKFNWILPKEIWSKEKHWNFAKALQDALAITSGDVVRARYHESYRQHRLAKEYNLNGETSSLGVVFQLFDYPIVPKDIVGKLSIFLSEESEEEYIIRKIYWQVVDASKQNSDGGQALLLSTILEASLRTLCKQPYEPGRHSSKDPYKLNEAINRFQSEYLVGTYESGWKNKIPTVIAAYKRLRHRYAHPDWVRSQGGMLSDAEIEQSINDSILLSRFYGYMILSLAGFKNLEPKFPAPFTKWGSIMTMESKPSQSSS
jgi:hypothetical protein